MARYLDTGAGDSTHCIGSWLEGVVSEGLSEFRTQVGYYKYAAIEPFAVHLRARAEAGADVHFVVGSNRGALSREDLRQTLRIVEGTAKGSLVVVSFSNALFHPKCIHIKKTNGQPVALVGSGNMTGGGMGMNVEAAVVLDREEGDEAESIRQVAAAIDRWRGLEEENGVFLIRSENDIHELYLSSIVEVPQPGAPPAPPPTPGQEGATTRRQGKRRRLWGPKRRRGKTTRRRKRPAAVTVAAPVVARVAPAPAPATTPDPAFVLPHHRWCKQMPSSDAQWVLTGTNATGKLRFAQAGFSINRNTYFRRDLFGSAVWQTVTRAGKPYDVAEVTFDVTVRGTHLGPLVLRIDHAPHREANQDNVPTVLAWGTRLGALLARASHIDDWVVIERDTTGAFKLTIQQNRPAWAP